MLTYIYSASTSHDRDKAPGSGKRTNECRENPERVEKYQALLHELADLSDPKTRTKDTLRSISAMFAGDSTNLILSENFTEQKVKDYPLQDYRIIFFATHGLLPGETACQPEPSLVASPPDSAQEGDDGLIDANEILHFKLDADLVVLSACNTGGRSAEETRIRGESLSGLSRAFFFAGARTIVASHWYLSATDTARLMTNMFKSLYNEKDPKALAVALNLAQQELMKGRSTSHPFFWAGLSLVGDGARSLSPLKTQ